MGAIRENRCLLIAFSTVLGLLICMEIALGVSLLALAKGRNLGLVVNQKMLSSMKHYEREGHDGVTKGNLMLFNSILSMVSVNNIVYFQLTYGLMTKFILF